MNYTNLLYGLNYDNLSIAANNVKDWSYENKFLYLLFGIVVLQELIYKNKLNKVLEQLASKVSKDIYIDLYSDSEDEEYYDYYEEDKEDEDYEEEEEEEEEDYEEEEEEEEEDYEEEEEEDEDEDEDEDNDYDDIKLIYENNIKNMTERIKKLEKKCSDLENLVDTIIVDKEETIQN